ncbi:MAG TPA: DUF448 domain-containing protein, partial [Hyphomicrobiaceae bacterium]|nr:DUF448 domain-containing protein [Hyphomicrobiaceae bacterium]
MTRAVLPREALVRFVAAPDGQIVPDLAERLPGRGVWVGCSRSVLAEAVRSKAFARGLKRQVEHIIHILQTAEVAIVDDIGTEAPDGR